MEPNRKTDRILGEWHAVSASARPPVKAPRSRGPNSVWSALGLAGAGLLAAGLVVAVAAFGGRPSSGVGGPGPSATASEVAVAPSESPSAAPSQSPVAATSSPSAKPTHTPRPTTMPTRACGASDLSAKIVTWEGAAGSRIATVDMTVTGASPCVLASPTPVRLVDGTNQVLAGPGAPASSSSITVQPAEKLSTLVQVSNVCVASPTAPVTLEFQIGTDWLRAKPVSPTDNTVPPCNGPGQPAEIQMQAWTKA